MTTAADGTRELDLRVTLETDDGALIHMTFTGVRDDANHYFRTLPRFETAAPSTRSSIACSRWVLGRVTETGRFTPSRRFSETPAPADRTVIVAKNDRPDRSSALGCEHVHTAISTDAESARLRRVAPSPNR